MEKPKSRREVDHHFLPNKELFMEVTADIRMDILLGASKSLSYTESQKQEYASTIIKKYFHNLDTRFEEHTSSTFGCALTYLNVLDFGFDDFGIYGSKRLLSYIQKGKSFLKIDDQTCANYGKLMEKYFQIIPQELQTLREQFLTLRVAQINGTVVIPLIKWNMLEVEWTTYQEIDSEKLNNSLKTIADPDDQMEHFLKTIVLPEESRAKLEKLIETIEDTLNTSQLRALKPKLYLFGSIMNGLSAYDSDLDVILRFEAYPSLTTIDYETAVCALEVIRVVLEQDLDLKIDKRYILPGRRCPILKLDFAFCLRQLERNKLNRPGLMFNTCDISLRSLQNYYNSKVIHFFTKYDRRFYEMSMLLKYWAKRAGLIFSLGLSSYTLYLMIVFFLQNTTPQVLPSIETLKVLARKQQPPKEQIKIEQYNFEFCDNIQFITENIGKCQNTQSTNELIVKFFEFYDTFDYRKFGLCPRLGIKMEKETIYSENITKAAIGRNLLADSNSQFRKSFVVIEDIFVTDNNVGSNFRAENHDRWVLAVREALCNLKYAQGNVVPILVRAKPFDMASDEQKNGGGDTRY